MNKGFIIVIGVVLGAGLSYAEVTTDRSLRLGYAVAVERPSMREDLLIPLAFSGVGGEIGFHVCWSARDWSGTGSLDLGMAYLQNDFGHGGVQLQPQLHISAARSIFTSSAVGRIALSLPLHLGITNHYLFSWDDAHLYWVTAHWTGLGVDWEHLIGAWRVHGSISLPLLSLVSRPPAYRHNKQDALKQPSFYFTRTNDDLQVALPDDFRGWRCALGLSRPMKRSDLGFEVLHEHYTCRSIEQAAFTASWGLRLVQEWRVAR